MRRYFIIAAVLLGAIACTKNEVAPFEAETPISFQVASFLSQTKAAANAEYAGTTFGCYAWYDSEALDGENQEFMVNETIEKAVIQAATETTPAVNEWKPAGKTYFWPKTGDIDFFAYAPKMDTPWVVCDDSNHKLSASKTTIKGDEDFLYSSMSMNYEKNVDPALQKEYSHVNAGVPILFHHALAQLTVNFAAAETEKSGNTWVITVNKAEFVNVANAGTLAMEMEDEADGLVEWTLPENSIWAASEDDADFAPLVAAQNLSLTKTLAPQKLSGRTVLPQSLAGMKFHINFTIKTSHDGGRTFYSVEDIDRNYDVATIFSTAGAYWKMNTKITYNVTISPNSTSEVLFDPAVVDWAPEVSADYTINN